MPNRRLDFPHRVLGKFGGGNRKMMIEPQALEYCGAAENEKCEKEDPGE